MMNASQIEPIVLSWWTGMDADGKPLAIWASLDRNHFRPDLDHLRGLLAAAGAAKYSVRAQVIGTTPDDAAIEIELHDEPPSPVIVGDEKHATPPNPGAAAAVIVWRPPAPTDADKRTVMDVKYLGRAHSRHVRERAETAASMIAAREKAAAAARAVAAKTDRSLRAEEDA